MPDTRMDAVLDHLSAVLVRDAMMREYLTFLVQAMLCTSEGAREVIAREMLSVIRGDDDRPNQA